MKRTKQSVFRIAYMTAIVATLTGAGFVGSKRLTEQGASGVVVSAGEDAATPGRIAHAMESVDQEPTKITIYVTGSVAKPGLYEIAPGVRIIDAIERAGGSTPTADLEALNLAQRIGDGQHVAVPELPAGKVAREVAIPSAQSRHETEQQRTTSYRTIQPEAEAQFQTT